MSNIYLLVEGDQTEVKFYPRWFEIYLSDYKRVKNPTEATNNCFYLFSGGGIPSIFDHYLNALKDITDNDRFNYDSLWVCLDVENSSIEELREKFEQVTNEFKLPSSISIHLVFQNKCIETWFLGNKKVYPRNSSSGFRAYKSHYNVSINDPELMESPNSETSIGAYHYKYLSAMLREKNMLYKKGRLDDVANESYLNQIIKRAEETNDLRSFRILHELTNDLNNQDS